VTDPGGRWTVPVAAEGERLDRALAAHLDLPRHRVQRWIRDGRVLWNGAPAAKTGLSLAAGGIVEWTAPPTTDDRVRPETGDLALLFEDPHVVVIDKPAGLVVHPGAGRRAGTLVHRLLARYPEMEGVGGPGRPGVVHRLDRGTSGVLVVARTDEAYRGLSEAFASRAVDKRYLALVWGHPRGTEGRIDQPIGRHPVDRKRMAVRPRGRAAATGWRHLADAGPVSALELALWTGRTHQIRVHVRSIGHPLVGDPVYGEARHRALRGPTAEALESFPRPALHAWSIAFAHPVGGALLRFEAPIPGDLVDLWRRCGGDGLAALRTGATPPGGAPPEAPRRSGRS